MIFEVNEWLNEWNAQLMMLLCGIMHDSSNNSIRGSNLRIFFKFQILFVSCINYYYLFYRVNRSKYGAFFSFNDFIVDNNAQFFNNFQIALELEISCSRFCFKLPNRQRPFYVSNISNVYQISHYFNRL